MRVAASRVRTRIKSDPKPSHSAARGNHGPANHSKPLLEFVCLNVLSRSSVPILIRWSVMILLELSLVLANVDWSTGLA